MTRSADYDPTSSNVYEYTVTGKAVGNAEDTASQQIQVTKKCESFAVGIIEKVKGPFNIPELTIGEVDLYTAKTDYVQSPNAGCEQQISYELTHASDGSSGTTDDIQN